MDPQDNVNYNVNEFKIIENYVLQKNRKRVSYCNDITLDTLLLDEYEEPPLSENYINVDNENDESLDNLLSINENENENQTELELERERREKEIKREKEYNKYITFGLIGGVLGATYGLYTYYKN